MTTGYLLFFLTLLIFGGAAVLALIWAISSGQMENMSRGANSIFDVDEPVGEMTDMVLSPPDGPCFGEPLRHRRYQEAFKFKDRPC